MADSMFSGLSPELLQMVSTLLQNPGVLSGLLGAMKQNDEGSSSSASFSGPAQAAPMAPTAPPEAAETITASALPPPPPPHRDNVPRPGAGGRERKRQLLKAVKPFLNTNKQHSVDNALRIAEVVLLLRHTN